jgi:predicted Zn-dependent peptidase
VAALAADVADEGTASHPGEAFAEAVESTGAQLSARAAYQSTRLGVDVAAGRLDTALGLLVEALQQPRYDPKDVARHIDDELTALADMEANPFTKTANAARAALFPENWRESRRANGDQDTLSAIDAAAVSAFHAANWSPNAATLILSGQLPDDIADIVRRTLGGWQGGDTTPANIPAPPTAPPLPPVRPRQVWIVDHPGAVQSIVNISCLTPTRGHADLEPLQVGAIAMGGSFLSRLNRVLREERGYTYGAGCAVVPLRTTGTFTAQARCRNDVVGPLLAELLTLLEIAERPFTQAEIDDAVDYAIGVAPVAYDTADAIASQAGGFVAAGMTPEWFDIHQRACLAVTPDAATTAFTRWIDPSQVHVVVGGDAAVLLPQLAALGLGPTVVDAFGQPVR